jgi:AcrR family transcriptional regulator
MVTEVPTQARQGGPTQARGGRAAKRAAILTAARAVFGREGYSRSSIDAIAGEAGVSTRTIYNHFPSKEELFNVVLMASATQVADDFHAALRRELPPGPPRADRLEADLVVIGRALARHSLDHPEHFAMIRQIVAEAGHFPREVLAGWREAGPLRVRREVADRLRGFAERGLLRVEDPFRAAGHLAALTSAEMPTPMSPWASPVTEEHLEDALRAAVRAFLHGYAPVPEPPPARSG